MSKSSRPTDAMEIGFSILGEIKVDDNVDGLNINTTCQKIGANEIAADPVTEIVEDTIAVRLKHASMAVEARVT